MTIKQALGAAIKRLEKDIDSSLSTDVFNVVRDTEVNKIYTDVYSKYDPKKYTRRGYYEGLADPYNIEMVGGGAKNGTIIVINTTEPNSGGVPAAYKDSVTTDKDLVELVEYGHGYNNNYYDFPRKGREYMKPRPFTADTITELRVGRGHIDALSNSLRKKGYNVTVVK